MVLAVLAAGCARLPGDDRAVLTPVSWDELAGWRDHDTRPALAALGRSCPGHLARPPAAPVGPHGIAGTGADWQAACRALSRLGAGPTKAAAGAYFRRHFRPFAVTGRDGADGLFTGYYEYELKGARQPSARYRVALYRRPGDLVSADLGAFSAEMRGRSIAGRVKDGRLVPYDDRAAINDGALKGRGLELLWVDDPVDAFILQIQGSGRVVLEDGSVVRVGFAGKNGHAYTAIGRELAAMGALDAGRVSMQAIRAWLVANPVRARRVMNRNRSFIFFRELMGPGPIGSEGVPLTSGASLAVDRAYLPLGVPLWIEADDLGAGPGAGLAPIRRLVVAQDTGGAIRGVVRGDLFLGAGAGAEAQAGRMKMRGRYYLLKPVAGDRMALGGGGAR